MKHDCMRGMWALNVAVAMLALCAHALTDQQQSILIQGTGSYTMTAAELVTLSDKVIVTAGETLSITSNVNAATEVLPVFEGNFADAPLFFVASGGTVFLQGLHFKNADTVLEAMSDAVVQITECVFDQTVSNALDITFNETSTAPVNITATENYYGHESGPFLESRPYGKGATIVEHSPGAIVYAPFYRDAELSQLAQLYFVSPSGGNAMTRDEDVMVRRVSSDTVASLEYNFINADGEKTCTNNNPIDFPTGSDEVDIDIFPCDPLPSAYILRVYAVSDGAVQESDYIDFAYTLNITAPIVTTTVFEFEDVVAGDTANTVISSFVDHMNNSYSADTNKATVTYTASEEFHVHTDEPLDEGKLTSAILNKYADNFPGVAVKVIIGDTSFVSSSRRLMNMDTRREFMVKLTYSNNNATAAEIQEITTVLLENIQTAMDEIMDTDPTVESSVALFVTTTVNIATQTDTYNLSEEDANTAYENIVQSLQEAITATSAEFPGQSIELEKDIAASVNEILLEVQPGTDTPAVPTPEIPDQVIRSVNFDVEVVLSGINTVDISVSVPYEEEDNDSLICPMTYVIDVFPNDDSMFGIESPCRNFDAFTYGNFNEVKPSAGLWQTVDASENYTDLLSEDRTTYRPLTVSGIWSAVQTTSLDAQNSSSINAIKYMAIGQNIQYLQNTCVLPNSDEYNIDESAVAKLETDSFTQYTFNIYVSAIGRSGDCSTQQQPLTTTTRSFPVSYVYNKATATAQVDVQRDSSLVITKLTLSECTKAECENDTNSTCPDLYLRRLKVVGEVRMFSTEDDRFMKVVESPVGVYELDENPGDLPYNGRKFLDGEPTENDEFGYWAQSVVMESKCVSMSDDQGNANAAYFSDISNSNRLAFEVKTMECYYLDDGTDTEVCEQRFPFESVIWGDLTIDPDSIVLREFIQDTNTTLPVFNTNITDATLVNTTNFLFGEKERVCLVHAIDPARAEGLVLTKETMTVCVVDTASTYADDVMSENPQKDDTGNVLGCDSDAWNTYLGDQNEPLNDNPVLQALKLRDDGDLDNTYLNQFTITEPPIPLEVCPYSYACYSTCWELLPNVFSDPAHTVRIYVEAIGAVSAYDDTATPSGLSYEESKSRVLWTGLPDMLLPSARNIDEPAEVPKTSNAIFGVRSADGDALSPPPPPPPSSPVSNVQIDIKNTEDKQELTDVYLVILIVSTFVSMLVAGMIALLVYRYYTGCPRHEHPVGYTVLRDSPSPGEAGSSMYGEAVFASQRRTAGLMSTVRGRPVAYHTLCDTNA